MTTPFTGASQPMRVTAENGLRLRATPAGVVIRTMPLGEVVTAYPSNAVQAPDYTWIPVRGALGGIGYAASLYLEAVPVQQPYGLGIDVSQAQTAIDWQRVKAAGYSFAFIRATQGKADSRPVGKDTAFVAHIDAALAAGLEVGVYHAYLPDGDGAAQAHFFMDTVRPYRDRLSFPLAVDVEVVNGQSNAVISGRLYDLATTLEALGAGLPMIYTSFGFWDTHITSRADPYFSRCPLWLAQWTNAVQPTLPRTWKGKTWALWQWRVQDGGIPGYGKRIDLNRRNP